MEETFADNLNEPSLQELISKIMEIYQRKFGERSELDEPKTEEYMLQTKRRKQRRIDSTPKELQSIPTRNNYEALATDDSDVEDMQDGTDDEIMENTKEGQSKKQGGKEQNRQTAERRRVQTQGRTDNN
ncbi:hypothetical protein Trydic_g11745 [Trypoxylus dichotomus]